MGIKKIAIPINKAKNDFVKWLKNNESTYINEFEGGKDNDWDYYRHITALINDRTYISIIFMMYEGGVEIDYHDDDLNKYEKMSIDELLEMINHETTDKENTKGK